MRISALRLWFKWKKQNKMYITYFYEPKERGIHREWNKRILSFVISMESNLDMWLCTWMQGEDRVGRVRHSIIMFGLIALLLWFGLVHYHEIWNFLFFFLNFCLFFFMPLIVPPHMFVLKKLKQNLHLWFSKLQLNKSRNAWNPWAGQELPAGRYCIVQPGEQIL